jgi:hypothetical protein
MTTVTLELPDELALRFNPLRDRVSALVSQALESLSAEPRENGLRFSSDYPIFDGMIDFLASGPTPQQILEHKASPDLQERLEELLDNNREFGLTETERKELDAFREVNHVMIMLKARARRAMQTP